MALLLWTLYFILRLCAHALVEAEVNAPTVAFLSGPRGSKGASGNCQFGRYFFRTPYYPENICMKVTCYASEKRLVAERCSNRPPRTKFCILKAQPTTGRFPHCCAVYTCNGNEAMSFGIAVTYTANGTRAHPEQISVRATGNWSAETSYLFSACTRGTCRYRDRIIRSNVTSLSAPCEAAQLSDKKDYVIVTRCPIFDRNIHECAMIDIGERTAQYPECCPLYMCPPTGYETRTVQLKNAPVDVKEGQCIYKGQPFHGSWANNAKCVNLTCDVTRKSVSGITCLGRKYLTWPGCVDVSGGIKYWNGAVPHCCPDLVCPHMTVEDGLPEQKIHRAEDARLDVCTYKTRRFRKTVIVRDVCERWTCFPKRKEVLVESCQETEEDLGEYCQWEFVDTRARFPDCCKKKVCRYRYPTRFPGLAIAQSPLKTASSPM